MHQSYSGYKIEQFDIYNAILRPHVREVQTLKNSPVFGPACRSGNNAELGCHSAFTVEGLRCRGFQTATANTVHKIFQSDNLLCGTRICCVVLSCPVVLVKVLRRRSIRFIGRRRDFAHLQTPSNHNVVPRHDAKIIIINKK